MQKFGFQMYKITYLPQKNVLLFEISYGYVILHILLVNLNESGNATPATEAKNIRDVTPVKKSK